MSLSQASSYRPPASPPPVHHFPPLADPVLHADLRTFKQFRSAVLSSPPINPVLNIVLCPLIQSRERKKILFPRLFLLHYHTRLQTLVFSFYLLDHPVDRTKSTLPPLSHTFRLPRFLFSYSLTFLILISNSAPCVEVVGEKVGCCGFMSVVYIQSLEIVWYCSMVTSSFFFFLWLLNISIYGGVEGPLYF